jgi:hypothetical protein
MSLFTPEEFRDYVDNGDFEEHMVEEHLLREVLDPVQKKFLHDNDLTVVLIANGRYNEEETPGIYDWMRSVNASLGWKLYTVV